MDDDVGGVGGSGGGGGGGHKVNIYYKNNDHA